MVWINSTHSTCLQCVIICQTLLSLQAWLDGFMCHTGTPGWCALSRIKCSTHHEKMDVWTQLADVSIYYVTLALTALLCLSPPWLFTYSLCHLPTLQLQEIRVTWSTYHLCTQHTLLLLQPPQVPVQGSAIVTQTSTTHRLLVYIPAQGQGAAQLGAHAAYTVWPVWPMRPM